MKISWLSSISLKNCFRFKQGTQKKELRDEAFHFVQLLLEAFAQKQVEHLHRSHHALGFYR